MENLFRFTQNRKAHRESVEVDYIDLSTQSNFQIALGDIGNGESRKQQVKARANQFTQTKAFLADKLNKAEIEKLRLLSEAMVELTVSLEDLLLVDLIKVLENALGEDPQSFSRRQAVIRVVGNLKDTIVAIKLLPQHQKHPIRLLVEMVRSFETLKQLCQKTNVEVTKNELAILLRRPLKLPNAIFYSSPPPRERPERPDLEGKLQFLAERYKRVDHAIKEMGAFRPDQFVSTVQKPLEAVMPPEEFRPTNLFAQEVELRQRAMGATYRVAADTIANGGNGQGQIGGSISAISQAQFVTNLSSIGSQEPGLSIGASSRIALTGRPAFKPQTGGLFAMRLSRESVSSMSSQTIRVLKEAGLNPNHSIPQTVERLLVERGKLYQEAQQIFKPVTQKSYQRINGTLVAIKAFPQPHIFGLNPVGLLDNWANFTPFFTPQSVPISHADLKPAGIMDLLLVKQQLKGYLAAEVSSIENVLEGEVRERSFRRRLESETFSVRETEIETTTESSLETTDRFEIRREAQKALQEQTSVKGSLTVSGSYGPSFSFTASGETSWSRREQQSTSSASEMAREVTQKASEKVTERIFSRETRRVTREVENINRHAFDNTEGDGHVVGVYQWVSKLYEAQVFNYGRRTMYDLMIPEPGAFLMEAFQRRHIAALELDKPAAFEVTPSYLTEDNYQSYIVLYGATDIKPPPQPYITEGYDFNTGGEDKDQEFTNSTTIKIPDGYHAVQASIGVVVAVWDDWSVGIIIGQRSHHFVSEGRMVWTTPLQEETGAIPLAMTTDKVGDVSMAVEVICQSTGRALALWQAETHAKLTEAYQLRLSEYEVKLAELQAEAPMEIESGPSALNQKLMDEEVKKACISILTEQHFDHFDAIDEGTMGLPEIVFSEARAEGDYVRFFEQAFEWENIAWIPYSYFWGQKKSWLDRIAIQDDDQSFADFLKAGYARVVLPVRPGFEAAVDHFRIFGEIWNGGSLPSISDEDYLPIADEIAERLGRPGNEYPQGNPWEVEVATSLVRLRTDGQLPKWEKQEDGNWKEIE
jgi:hypothetical protein